MLVTGQVFLLFIPPTSSLTACLAPVPIPLVIGMWSCLLFQSSCSALSHLLHTLATSRSLDKASTHQKSLHLPNRFSYTYILMSGLGRRSRVCTLINFSYLSVVLLVRSKGGLRYSHGPTFDGWSVRESRYQVERADKYGCVGGYVIKSL